MSDAPPTLSRGIGVPAKCRACKAPIVFAITYTNGKNAPFEADETGEWVLTNGIAKHVGPVPTQLELGAPEQPPRFTSHFARCPAADSFRSRR